MAIKYVCVDIHRVRQKDTLYSIAEHYGMNVDLLMRVNGIRNPYNLKVGSRICIPGMIVDDNDNDHRPPQNDNHRPPQNDNHRPPQNDGNRPSHNRPSDNHCRTVYTVRTGDTLYMIAKMHQISLDALLDANPEVDPYRLHRGMEICIPG